ncbi:MAG: hypothetical protein EAZ65_06475 [Verrucomicrobia bacterium]|nr:MAG: hypothetical protein EAZ65_06475 [Verrucomicrobiota bacterium]
MGLMDEAAGFLGGRGAANSELWGERALLFEWWAGMVGGDGGRGWWAGMVGGDGGRGWWTGMVDGDGGRGWWTGMVDGDGGRGFGRASRLAPGKLQQAAAVQGRGRGTWLRQQADEGKAAAGCRSPRGCAVSG